MYATLACPDWATRLEAGESLIPPLPLHAEKAATAVKIFNKLRLPDVIGQPTLGEACGDWQRDIVAALFGGFVEHGESRFIREIFNLVPKKNNKTTGAAAIMMTALLVNERPRAEFLLVGPTQAVAETAFSQAVGMIEADPYLAKRFHCVEHTKLIRDRTNGAKLKIKTFDTKVLVGVKPVGVLIDELHEIGKDAKAAKVLRQIRGGILPFPEGFLIIITTQSDDAPTGVFKEELQKARAIRDGKQQGNMLPVLYEFPVRMMKDGSWRNPENWWMVTPNRDRSITIEALIEDFAGEEPKGDAAIRLWASQHLNIEIGIALGGDSWAGAEFWLGNTETGKSNVDRTLTFAELLKRSEVVVVHIDGGGLDDLLGFAALGREIGTGHWLLWNHAWAHKIVLKRRKDIAAKLEDLEALNQLTIVAKPGDDVDEVALLIMQVENAGLLAEEDAIGVDSFGVTDITKALTGDEFGIALERIVGIPQGWQLNGAIKTTERALAGGTLVHGGLELMNWCVENARVEPRGNAISITKQVSGSAKIDPLMATFGCVVLMGRNPQPAGTAEVFAI